MPEVISDTSPLQYLFQAESLDIVPALYGTVLVPEGVAEEIATGRTLGHSLPDLESLDWIRIVVAPHPRILLLAADLGLSFTGTLGVLLRAKDAGHLHAVKPIIDRLEALGFRLDSATRSAVLDLAGES